MHISRSGIDTPLKVSSVFGVISGVLLPSSAAYAVLTLYRPVDYSSLLNTLFFILLVMIYGLFVIFGSLVVLSANMSIERRGVLAFFVFLASVFAVIVSSILGTTMCSRLLTRLLVAEIASASRRIAASAAESSTTFFTASVISTTASSSLALLPIME